MSGSTQGPPPPGRCLGVRTVLSLLDTKVGCMVTTVPSEEGEEKAVVEGEEGGPGPSSWMASYSNLVQI